MPFWLFTHLDFLVPCFLSPTNCISLSDPIAGSLVLISGLILAPGVVAVVWCGGRFVSVPGRPPLLSLEEAHLLPGLISAPLKLPAIPLEVTHQPQNSPPRSCLFFYGPYSVCTLPFPQHLSGNGPLRVGKKKKIRLLSYPCSLEDLVLIWIMLIATC